MDCPGRKGATTLKTIRPTKTYLIPVNKRYHLTGIELKNEQPRLYKEGRKAVDAKKRNGAVDPLSCILHLAASAQISSPGPESIV